MSDQQQYEEKQMTIFDLHHGDDQYAEKIELSVRGKFRLIEAIRDINKTVFDGYYYLDVEGYEAPQRFSPDDVVTVRIYPEIPSADDAVIMHAPPADNRPPAPDWQVGDRVQATKQHTNWNVPANTMGTVELVTGSGRRIWIDWDNGDNHFYEYDADSPDHGIIKIASAPVDETNVVVTPDWQVGDRVALICEKSVDEDIVHEGTLGTVTDKTYAHIFVDWENGLSTFHPLDDDEILKLIPAPCTAQTKIITVTDSAPIGELDKWISTFLNEGWVVAFEAVNSVCLDGELQTIHTVRLQREVPITPDDTPTPLTSPIESLRQQAKALIEDDEQDDDPEPPTPSNEPIKEHNPALFLTAPDPIQTAINTVNAKIDHLLTKRYQEIANKYRGWQPVRFQKMAVSA